MPSWLVTAITQLFFSLNFRGRFEKATWESNNCRLASFYALDRCNTQDAILVVTFFRVFDKFDVLVACVIISAVTYFVPTIALIGVFRNGTRTLEKTILDAAQFIKGIVFGHFCDLLILVAEDAFIVDVLNNDYGLLIFYIVLIRGTLSQAAVLRFCGSFLTINLDWGPFDWGFLILVYRHVG